MSHAGPGCSWGRWRAEPKSADARLDSGVRIGDLVRVADAEETDALRRTLRDNLKVEDARRTR